MKEASLMFANLTLARRLEAMEAFACLDTQRTVSSLHPEIPAAAESIAGGWAVFTGVGSPISEARGLGMNGAVTDVDMDRLENFYRSLGDSIRMEVCPLADASLHQLLAARSYRLLEFSNMLARTLDSSVGAVPAPAEISTRLAEPSEARLWAETVAHCFAEHMPVTQELLDIVSCWTRSSICACFFGLVDGQVAGGATVAMHDGVALLGGAGTALRFRNRGLQRALIQTRLAHAARAGCNLAMTVTLPGSVSQRNCEREGFRVVYTRTKFTRE